MEFDILFEQLESGEERKTVESKFWKRDNMGIVQMATG